MLNGYKTYATGAGTILLALGGYLHGDMDFVAALQLGVPALLAIFIRHGVTTTAAISQAQSARAEDYAQMAVSHAAAASGAAQRTEARITDALNAAQLGGAKKP